MPSSSTLIQSGFSPDIQVSQGNFTSHHTPTVRLVIDYPFPKPCAYSCLKPLFHALSVIQDTFRIPPVSTRLPLRSSSRISSEILPAPSSHTDHLQRTKISEKLWWLGEKQGCSSSHAMDQCPLAFLPLPISCWVCSPPSPSLPLMTDLFPAPDKESSARHQRHLSPVL